MTATTLRPGWSRPVRAAVHPFTEEVPTDHRRAVGHLRRMAWTLDKLIERLVAHQCFGEAP